MLTASESEKQLLEEFDVLPSPLYYLTWYLRRAPSEAKEEGELHLKSSLTIGSSISVHVEEVLSGEGWRY